MENERELILKINGMCIESLDPEMVSKWDEVKYWLEETRNRITWEFVEWSEKSANEAFLKGADDNGNNYEAIGIMGEGKIIEVNRNSINQLSFQTDKANNSGVLELKTKLIKDIRACKSSGAGEDSPDCFTMLYDYDVAMANLPPDIASFMTKEEEFLRKKYKNGDDLENAKFGFFEVISILEEHQRIIEDELCFNCGQVPSVNKPTGLCKKCYTHWNSYKKHNNLEGNG